MGFPVYGGDAFNSFLQAYGLTSNILRQKRLDDRAEEEYENKKKISAAQGLQVRLEGDDDSAIDEAGKLTGTDTGKKMKVLGEAGNPISAANEIIARRETKRILPSPFKALEMEASKYREQDSQTLQNVFQKMDAARQQGQQPALDLNEARVVHREFVNNPSISDDDPGGQYQALIHAGNALNMVGEIKQPTVIKDPSTLDVVTKALPMLTKGSNLKDAKVSGIYITPSQDGDPTKAQIVFGVSGIGPDGQPVDGVLTSGRSSSPNDTIRIMTSGELANMVDIKRKLYDGLLAVRAQYGDEKAVALYQEQQKNRYIANTLQKQAAAMKDGRQKQQLMVTASMIADGRMSLDESLKVAKVVMPEDEYKTISQGSILYNTATGEKIENPKESDGKVVTVGVGANSKQTGIYKDGKFEPLGNPWDIRKEGSGASAGLSNFFAREEYKERKQANKDSKKEIDTSGKTWKDAEKMAKDYGKRKTEPLKDGESYVALFDGDSGKYSESVYRSLREDANEKRRQYKAQTDRHVDEHGESYGPYSDYRKPASKGLSPSKPVNQAPKKQEQSTQIKVKQSFNNGNVVLGTNGKYYQKTKNGYVEAKVKERTAVDNLRTKYGLTQPGR